MSFRYFAYGSNLWPPRMRSRCPSAEVIDTATLHGWIALYDKPSTDGSAKLNIRPDASGMVRGVVYEIDNRDRGALDAAEPGYTPTTVTIGPEGILTYSYEGRPFNGPPYDWYVEMVLAGARHHGLEKLPTSLPPASPPRSACC